MTEEKSRLVPFCLRELDLGSTGVRPAPHWQPKSPRRDVGREPRQRAALFALGRLLDSSEGRSIAGRRDSRTRRVTGGGCGSVVALMRVEGDRLVLEPAEHGPDATEERVIGLGRRGVRSLGWAGLGWSLLTRIALALQHRGLFVHPQ
jgi:hypothetical protein